MYLKIISVMAIGMLLSTVSYSIDKGSDVMGDSSVRRGSELKNIGKLDKFQTVFDNYSAGGIAPTTDDYDE